MARYGCWECGKEKKDGQLLCQECKDAGVKLTAPSFNCGHGSIASKGQAKRLRNPDKSIFHDAGFKLP